MKALAADLALEMARRCQQADGWLTPHTAALAEDAARQAAYCIDAPEHSSCRIAPDAPHGDAHG